MKKTLYANAATDKFIPILHLDMDAQTARRMACRTKVAHFYRRTYLRCVFALIEGATFFLKEVVLHGTKKPEAMFSPAELFILRETAYSLDERGRVQERLQYFRVADNLRFIVALINRLFSVSVDLGVGSTGWQAFQKTSELRNTLTHPRPSDDVGVSDEQLELICQTHDWITGVLDQITYVIYPRRRARVTNNEV